MRPVQSVGAAIAMPLVGWDHAFVQGTKERRCRKNMSGNMMAAEARPEMLNNKMITGKQKAGIGGGGGTMTKQKARI